MILRTTNALTFVTDVTNDDPANPFIFQCINECELLFGAREMDLNNGATPALGKSVLEIKFISPEFGGAMPDIFYEFAINLESLYELVSISLHATATGSLPDGSIGKVKIDQVGRLVPGLVKLEKYFPVERIEIKSIGGDDF